MGGGKSSGSQTTTVQPMQEQKDLLKTQTDFLKETALPAYQQTVAGAKDIYGQVAPTVGEAAGRAMDVAGRAGAMQEAQGGAAYQTGLQGLKALFDTNLYEDQFYDFFNAVSLSYGV